jgi:alkylation response protein AidB-like acyl-CoA dehydrogenase
VSSLAPLAGLAETQEQREFAAAIDATLDASWSEDHLMAFLAAPQVADPTAVSSALHELGLVGAVVPEGSGGLGLGWLDLISGLERLGHRLAPSDALETLTASELLRCVRGEPAAAEALNAHLEEEWPFTGVLVSPASEWGVGADLEVSDSDDSGRVRLTGTISQVGGSSPSTYLLAVTAAHGPMLVLVRAGSEGVTHVPLEPLDLLRPVGRLELAHASGEVVSTGPQVAVAIERATAAAVLILAAEQVGAADRCLARAVLHARERTQFGRAIGAFQAVRHRCAEMLVQVELARSAARKLAATLDATDDGRAGAPPASGGDALAVPLGLARVRATRALNEASRGYVQILGAMGFTWEVDAHLAFRKAGSTGAMLGSVNAHRRAVGRHLGLLSKEDGHESS